MSASERIVALARSAANSKSTLFRCWVARHEYH